MLPPQALLSIQSSVASLLCQTQSKIRPPKIKPRHSALKSRPPGLPLQLLTLPVFTDLVSPLTIAAAAALFAVRLTPAGHAFPAPLPLPSPSAAPTQRAGRISFGHQPLYALSSHGRASPVTSPHLEACQGEKSWAEGEPGTQEGLEVSAACRGVLFLLLRPRPTSLSISLSALCLCSLPFSWLAALCTQAGLLCGGRGESQQPSAHQQLCSMGQVEPAG